MKDGDPNTVVPGLMAVGEAACVSVHGANRLGSTRCSTSWCSAAPPPRCADLLTPGNRMRQLPHAGEEAIARFDKAAPRQGRTGTAQLRLGMQRTMQNDCAVFRTGRASTRGCAKLDKVIGGGRRHRVRTAR